MSGGRQSALVLRLVLVMFLLLGLGSLGIAVIATQLSAAAQDSLFIPAIEKVRTLSLAATLAFTGLAAVVGVCIGLRMEDTKRALTAMKWAGWIVTTLSTTGLWFFSRI